jgi:cell division septation protein DedD
MINLTVASDGTGTIDYVLKDVSLATGANSLFGPDGTALVIHADKDDEMTDPSGNSGARIACGLISKSGTTATAAPAAQASPVAQASPAAKPSAPAPAAKPAAPAAKPAAPAQAPASAKPAASPVALPRTGGGPVPFDPTWPAAIAGAGSMIAGLAFWRRRK